jgi:hypothetical protein
MKRICSLLLIFLGLCLPGAATAQTGATLLVTTGTSCDWKLDGQPMDPLKAGDSRAVPVAPGSHVIEASTADGASTIRTKVELDQGQKAVDILPKSENDPQSKAQDTETTREPNRQPASADAALGLTWTDPSTGLMWAGKDNGSDVGWTEADAYCSKLQLGGYKGWRLPTLDELQGIYDPTISVRTKFDNGVTYYVHAKGNLKLTGWHWSSVQGDAPGKPWQVAWMFNFGINEPRGVFPLGFDYSMRALCVRRSGE